MVSIHAYYDGHGYVTDEAVTLKPNQRVIITILDDFRPTRSPKTLAEIKSYMNASTKSVPAGQSTVDYIRQLRTES